MQVLYEELLDCSFPNNLSPQDTVGAVTYVRGKEEHISGDMEAIAVRSIGVKQCDVHRLLNGKELPVEVRLP